MTWFRRKKEEPAPSRPALLASKPLRHPQAREQPKEDGALHLEIPVPKRRLARWLTGNDRPVTRRFELDALGVEIWRRMDGRTTVRAMIESFAASHQLNLREAEVSILAYLRTLAGRGMMMLAVPHEENGKESGKK